MNYRFSQKFRLKFGQKICQGIENPAYASKFITTSQKKKVTNEITGFLYL